MISNERLTVAMIGITQGLLDLLTLPIFYFYKDVLFVNAAEISFYIAVAMLPWIIKPIFGFISDQYPLFGYRRRSYLILATLVETLGILYIGMFASSRIEVLTCQFCLMFGLVFRNVIGEALIVSITQKDERDLDSQVTEGHKQGQAQSNVSLFFGVKAGGALVSAICSGYLIEIFGIRKVIILCALFSVVLNLYFIVFFEEPQEAIPLQTSFWNNMKEIVSVIFDQKFRIILLVALAHVLVPSFGGVYNYYYTEYLHFSPITMGQIHFVAISAYIFAIFIVNVYFKGVAFKNFFLTTNLLSTCLYASNFILLFRLNKLYGISDHLFCFSSTALSSFIAELTFLPILALGSRVCPPGLEGTTYAVFTAIFNSASYLSASMGAGLVWAYGVHKGDFSNLWKLTAIQVICLLVFGIAVIFINFPRIGGSKPAEDLKQSKTFSSLSRDAEDPPSNGKYFGSLEEKNALNTEKGVCKSVEDPTASTVRIAKRNTGTQRKGKQYGWTQKPTGNDADLRNRDEGFEEIQFKSNLY